MVTVAFGERVHSQGNVGSWCVGSQSRGSNEYREEREARPQRENGLAHLPTELTLAQPKHLMEARTYSFHPESSAAIHHLEEVFVLFTPKPTKSGDLKIRPEMAHVVLLALHCFGVDVWYSGTGWVTSENFFW
jgi:hypothetical protein